jgi:spermidine synthase
MVQWIGHPPEEQYRLLLRTFLSVFPEATLWEGSFLVGPRGSLRAPTDDFEAAHLVPELARALAEADIADATALLRLYTAGPAALRAFAGPGPVLTDDRPQVEYYRSLGDGGRRVDLSRLPAADPLELKR